MTKNACFYFDYNATTPLRFEVQEEIKRVLSVFGNPSSLHAPGRQAKNVIESAREKVAGFINAQPDEIVFTGSGTEANNAVLNAFACPSNECASHKPMRGGILVSAVEHPCVLGTAHFLREKGVSVRFLSVDTHGKVNRDELEKIFDDNIKLVSVIMANNEIGTIQDIQEISELVHKHDAYLHTDAVQAVGKIPVNVKELDVDYLALSGHKFYGPKGVGAIYIKKGSPFCSLIRGGGQEFSRRAGTENILGIAGIGKAAEMRGPEMDAEKERLVFFKNKLKKGIEQKIEDICFNGDPFDCLPGTLNVSFKGIEGEALLMCLDQERICASTGSACSSGSLSPSHVLSAIQTPDEMIKGSLRLSLGRDTTHQEVDHLLATLPPIIQRLRG